MLHDVGDLQQAEDAGGDPETAAEGDPVSSVWVRQTISLAMAMVAKYRP
jgi:hypothetical protein